MSGRASSDAWLDQQTPWSAPVDFSFKKRGSFDIGEYNQPAASHVPVTNSNTHSIATTSVNPNSRNGNQERSSSRFTVRATSRLGGGSEFAPRASSCMGSVGMRSSSAMGDRSGSRFGTRENFHSKVESGSSSKRDLATPLETSTVRQPPKPPQTARSQTSMGRRHAPAPSYLRGTVLSARRHRPLPARSTTPGPPIFVRPLIVKDIKTKGHKTPPVPRLSGRSFSPTGRSYSRAGVSGERCFSRNSTGEDRNNSRAQSSLWTGDRAEPNEIFRRDEFKTDWFQTEEQTDPMQKAISSSVAANRAAQRDVSVGFAALEPGNPNDQAVFNWGWAYPSSAPNCSPVSAREKSTELQFIEMHGLGYSHSGKPRHRCPASSPSTQKGERPRLTHLRAPTPNSVQSRNYLAPGPQGLTGRRIREAPSNASNNGGVNLNCENPAASIVVDQDQLAAEKKAEEHVLKQQLAGGSQVQEEDKAAEVSAGPMFTTKTITVVNEESGQEQTVTVSARAKQPSEPREAKSLLQLPDEETLLMQTIRPEELRSLTNRKAKLEAYAVVSQERLMRQTISAQAEAAHLQRQQFVKWKHMRKQQKSEAERVLAAQKSSEERHDTVMRNRNKKLVDKKETLRHLLRAVHSITMKIRADREDAPQMRSNATQQNKERIAQLETQVIAELDAEVDRYTQEARFVALQYQAEAYKVKRQNEEFWQKSISRQSVVAEDFATMSVMMRAYQHALAEITGRLDELQLNKSRMELKGEPSVASMSDPDSSHSVQKEQGAHDVIDVRLQNLDASLEFLEALLMEDHNLEHRVAAWQRRLNSSVSEQTAIKKQLEKRRMQALIQSVSRLDNETWASTNGQKQQKMGFLFTGSAEHDRLPEAFASSRNL